MARGGAVTVRSSRWTAPDVGAMRPEMQRSSVVLPQPDGPTMHSSSPGSAVKLISSMAVKASPPPPHDGLT
jgi:hypothetical protein